MIVLNEDLTKENIYKYISSYEIFKTYSSEFKDLNKSFFSDFREETHPSCQITIFNGDLLYTDFGLGKSFRAIDFVMYKFNLNYYEALEKINRDFNLNLGVLIDKDIDKKFKITPRKSLNESFIINKSFSKNNRVKLIQIKQRDFTKEDLAYWGKYGIKKETLKLFNVTPISHFWIDGNMFYAHKYSYSYNFELIDGVFRRKIYQPFSKYKWLSNGGKIIQGKSVIPDKGDLLVITKSLKDVMTLYELGYYAVSPPSESSFIDKAYIKELQERFTNIYIFFDNDEAGITFASKYKELYNIGKSIIIPNEYNAKDISDFTCIYGINSAKNLINFLL